MQKSNLHKARPSLISRVLSVCCAFVLAFMMVPATAISAFAQEANTEVVLTLDKSTMTGYVGITTSTVRSVLADGVALTEEQKADLVWSSSDENVFTVATDGKITGVAVGSATLTATWSGKIATCAVTVKEPTLSLNTANTKNFVGTTFTPSLKYGGEELTSDEKANVVWTSSDAGIIAVATDGTISYVAVGQAKITATWNDMTASKTVAAKLPELKFKTSTQNGIVGNAGEAPGLKYAEEDLTAEQMANVVWASSDESILTVATDGTITYKAVGKANLTATWDGKTATCAVTVKEAVAEFTNTDGETKYVGEIKSKTMSSGTYKLLADYVLSESKLEPNALATDVTINLNGYNLTINGTSGNPAIYLTQENSVFKITGEGTVTDAGSGIAVLDVNAAKCTVTIDSKVTLKSTNGYGVMADSDAAGSTITINGTVVAKAAGAYVNGNIASPGATININAGASVTGEAAGIYAAGIGTYNIKGGTVSGGTGIYAKAGKINISGGSVTATGSKVDYTPVAAGFEATGDAIVLDSMAGYGDLSVSITGGTFTSTNASAVACYTDDEVADPITKPVISGGTYSSPVDESYFADNYFPMAKGDGTYGVVKFTLGSTKGSYTRTAVAGNTGAVPTAYVDGTKMTADQLAEVAWTSSNEAIFTVAADGSMKYVAAGSATLSATWKGVTATCTVTVSEAVAEYTNVKGETSYKSSMTSLQMGTYKLLTDYTPSTTRITMNVTFRSAAAPANAVIDLNGHNITISGTSSYPAIVISQAYNNLTIKGEGTITDTGNGISVVGASAKNCEIVIGEKVTLVSTNSYGVIADSKAAGSTITINGTVKAKYAGAYINGSIASPGATINIEDGASVSGKSAGIYAAGLGTYNIKGGTVSGGTGIYAKAGTISISGGSVVATGAKKDYTPVSSGFESTGDSVVLDSMTGASLSVSVTAGSLTSENASVVGCYTDNEVEDPITEPVISGGTFSGPVDESYCAEGYIPKNNGDGTYGVKVGEYVVRIGQQGYETFADALGAYNDGDVIKLLKNQTPDANLSVGDSFIINLNGFTFDESAFDIGNSAYIDSTNNEDGTVTYVVKAVKDTADELQKQIDANKKAIEDANKAIKANKDAIDALDDTYATDADVASKIAAAKTAIETAQKAVDDAQANLIKANADDIDKLETAVADLKTSTASAIKTAVEALENGKVKNNADAIKSLQDAVDALDDTYATDAQLTSAINAAKEALQTQIDANKKAIEDANKAIKANKDAIDALDDTYATDADVASKIAAAKTAIETAQKAVDDAQANLINANAEDIAGLEDAVADLRTSTANAIKSAVEALENGKVKNNADAIKSLQDAVDALDDTYATDAQLASAIAAANAELKSYVDQENEALKAEIAKNKAAIEALQHALAQQAIDSVDTTAKATNASVTSIKVTWNVSKLATGYKLYYRVAGGKYALVEDFANNTTKTYTVTGLTCGKTYYFKVVPYVVSTSSEVVDGAAAYTGAKKLVPGKVTLTSAKSTKSKTITVTFKKITGVSGYEIFYRNWKNTSPYYKRVTGSTTSITKSLTKLARGNKYTVKVRAYKTVDGKRIYGAWSSYVYVTVK